MTTPRSQANQKLYHARILAQSWRRELQAESIPATVLADAFDPAARDHLRMAYGWFLLAITQPATLPDTPPGNCDALPEIAEGQALPGEIRELQQLEQRGWLADMLGSEPFTLSTAKASANLALPVAGSSGPDLIDQWIDKLQETFDRMADSLDEY
jgi:hypothetical protein